MPLSVTRLLQPADMPQRFIDGPNSLREEPNRLVDWWGRLLFQKHDVLAVVSRLFLVASRVTMTLE